MRGIGAKGLWISVFKKSANIGAIRCIRVLFPKIILFEQSFEAQNIFPYLKAK
jgi:hypothetical protein